MVKVVKEGEKAKRRRTPGGTQGKIRGMRGSLTVEAAFVLPIFLFFMLAFLSFIQIIKVQEQIQSGITKMGLSLAKTAYIYDDFIDSGEANHFDQTIFGDELEVGLEDLAAAKVDSKLLKLTAKKYINQEEINHSYIVKGYEGISFDGSSLLNEEDCIDIVVNYQVRIPIKLIRLPDIPLLQRIKLRGWTGYEVEPKYSIVEDGADETNDRMVYITDSGSVYHFDKNCSHIKLSIRSVVGIPTALRNNNGAKYYPCETCCNGDHSDMAVYYITTDGTRYHTKRDCPGLKRTVIEIPLSKVAGRRPCKRCSGG